MGYGPVTPTSGRFFPPASRRTADRALRRTASAMRSPSAGRVPGQGRPDPALGPGAARRCRCGRRRGRPRLRRPEQRRRVRLRRHGEFVCDGGTGFFAGLVFQAVLSAVLLVVFQIIAAGLIRAALKVADGGSWEFSEVLRTDKIGKVVVAVLSSVRSSPSPGSWPAASARSSACRWCCWARPTPTARSPVARWRADALPWPSAHGRSALAPLPRRRERPVTHPGQRGLIRSPPWVREGSEDSGVHRERRLAAPAPT